MLAPERRRVSIALVVLMGLTLTPKLLGARGVDAPRADVVLDAFQAHFSGMGYDVAGQTRMLGPDALLIQRDGCMQYVLSLTAEGYDELTAKRATPAGFKIVFYFDGRLYTERQPRSRTLFEFYVRKLMRYAGLRVEYKPVIALILPDSCEPDGVALAQLPSIPFQVF